MALKEFLKIDLPTLLSSNTAFFPLEFPISFTLTNCSTGRNHCTGQRGWCDTVIFKQCDSDIVQAHLFHACGGSSSSRPSSEKTVSTPLVPIIRKDKKHIKNKIHPSTRISVAIFASFELHKPTDSKKKRVSRVTSLVFGCCRSQNDSEMPRLAGQHWIYKLPSHAHEHGKLVQQMLPHVQLFT